MHTVAIIEAIHRTPKPIAVTANHTPIGLFGPFIPNLQAIQMQTSPANQKDTHRTQQPAKALIQSLIAELHAKRCRVAHHPVSEWTIDDLLINQAGAHIAPANTANLFADRIKHLRIRQQLAILVWMRPIVSPLRCAHFRRLHIAPSLGAISSVIHRVTIFFRTIKSLTFFSSMNSLPVYVNRSIRSRK